MAKKLTLFLLLLTAAFSFSSCTKDDWSEFLIEDNAWVVTKATYGAPYQYGDMFYFYYNHRFVIEGPDLYETGSWRVQAGRLLIHFDGSPGDVHIEAPIPVLHSWRMVLDCFDYLFNMEYSLNLERDHSLNGYSYYSRQKQPEDTPTDSVAADTVKVDNP